MAVERRGASPEGEKAEVKKLKTSERKEPGLRSEKEPRRKITPEERAEALAEQKEKLYEAQADKEPAESGRKVDTSILGDFSPQDIKSGRIVLDEESKRAAEEQVQELQKTAFSLGRLAGGTKIAAAYDIKVNNFSTQTSIVTLPDGRRMFAVFADPASRIHRKIDGAVKHATGLRMGKVSRDEWKGAFEEHARIPLSTIDDQHTVLMPYVPNVNAYDAITNKDENRDFGEIEWAKEVTPEDRRELLQNMMSEIQDIHKEGIAWGECILKNLILTKEKRAIMCDPEVRYDAGVPLKEAQARDLKDFLISACTALREGEGSVDIKTAVGTLLDEYQDEKVLKELRKLCKTGFSPGLAAMFWNEKLRLGVESREEYDAILTAAKEYKR
jgi:hypothetical protein